MTIKVGVLGTGFANSVQIPAFQKSDRYDVEAIYGRTYDKATEIAKDNDIPLVYERWEDIVADDTLDLISVVTPVHEHYSMTVSALMNNKHVLCEKPMAIDIEEAFQMQQEVAHSGKIGMINHEFRQLPERRYFHDLIQEKTIGEIYEINIDITSSSRLPMNSQDRNWNWWADVHHGGGLWGALGSHLIDYILWTFGSIDSITGVLSTNNQYLKDQITGQTRLVTSDDTFHSLFKTEAGVTGRLTGSSTKHGNTGSLFEAFGSDGALRIDRDRTIWKADGDDWTELDIPDSYQLRDVAEDESWLIPPFEVLIAHLAEGIEQNRNPSPSFEDGLNVQYVLDALRQSHLENSWVTI